MYCYHCNGASIVRWWRAKKGKKIIIIIVGAVTEKRSQRNGELSVLHGEWLHKQNIMVVGQDT
jgi:hypothetical protein